MITVEPRNGIVNTDYVCEITKTLDRAAGFKEGSLMRHYLLFDQPIIKGSYGIPIRVPGGTVGVVFIDKTNHIKGINIDMDYVVKSYDKNTHNIMKGFLDKELQLPKHVTRVEENNDGI